MKIQTPNYNGAERRNGGKVKLTTGDWLKIIFTIAGLVSAGFAFYLQTNWNMNALANEQERNETAIESLKKENIEQSKIIVEVKSDVKHIKDDVKDIKESQKEQRELSYQILNEIRNAD